MKSLMRLIAAVGIFLALVIPQFANASLVIGGVNVDEAYSLYAEGPGGVKVSAVFGINEVGSDDVIASVDGNYFDGTMFRAFTGISSTGDQCTNLYSDDRPHFLSPRTCVEIGADIFSLIGIGDGPTSELYFAFTDPFATYDQVLDVAEKFTCFDGSGGTGPIGTPNCSQVSAVPEPGSIALMSVALGCLGITTFTLRRRKASTNPATAA